MRSRLVIVSMSLLAISGCSDASGGGGGGGGRGGGDDGTGEPPAGSGISFYSVHYHQDLYQNPRNFSFEWSVRNATGGSLSNLDWEVRRLDGDRPAVSGTINSVPVGVIGNGHTYKTEWSETSTGRHTYQITLDPNNLIEDADRSDNTVLFVVDVLETTRTTADSDLRFRGRTAHYHAALPNNSYTFHFEAENSSAPMSGVLWRLRNDELGIDWTRDISTIPAGGSVESSNTVQITQAGEYEFEVLLDSANTISEGDEENNTRRFVVIVAPSESG